MSSERPDHDGVKAEKVTAGPGVRGRDPPAERVDLGSPRTSAQTMNATRANVVTLIPPAVEALRAPTNTGGR